MNKIKSFVEKFQMFITSLPKFEATGTESTKSDNFVQTFIGLIQNITNSNNKSQYKTI